MTLLTKQEQKLVREFERRESLAKEILASLFPEQKELLLDPSRLKATQCGRRSGKSYTAGTAFAYTDNDYPGSSMLFIAPTLKQAKRILFKDILKPINRKFRLNIRFNTVEGIAHFPSGGVVYCMGADATKEEADKVLGQKFKLVVIDESASFKNDLRHLIYYSLLPALADLRGALWMMGTTGNNTNNLFFDIVGRVEGDPAREMGWSVHKWNWDSNPHTKDAVQELVDELRRKNPEIDKVSWFRQMYLNEWVIEESKLVYKYRKEKNYVDALPADHEWLYSLSVDLGYEDDTAFTVGAWSNYDPNFYFVKAYKQKGMDITAVADMVHALEKEFAFVKYVIDGSNKQAVEELRTRFGIPFIAADKRGKSDVIELMNADFVLGHIKALPAAEPLVAEWGLLTWAEQSPDKREKRAERPDLPNHCCDSGLYNWRMSYHFTAAKKISEPKPGTDAWMDKYVERVEKEIKEEQKRPWWRKIAQRGRFPI